MLELSVREALQLGHHYVDTEHLLLGILREGEGTAVQVLVSLGVDLSQIRQNALQLLAVEKPLPPAETGTGAYDLSDMSFFGTVPVWANDKGCHGGDPSWHDAGGDGSGNAFRPDDPGNEDHLAQGDEHYLDV